MSFKDYFKDKAFYIVSYLISLILLLLIFRAFNVNPALTIMVFVILISLFILLILYGYYRRLKFYNDLISNVNNMDKAYYVLATLESPDFYDGKILYDALYTINKSMIENIKTLEKQNEDFKEYIEMWIHEVKIPLSTLSLMIHNHKNSFDKKTIEQIKRINDYVEQVLYYARSENAEKDYIITSVKLEKVINQVALKNKDTLLDNKIDLIVKNINYEIYTDAKWLEFILNQVVSNSIKYKKDDEKSYIEIYVEEINGLTKLFIKDNGIGIPKEDIKRVFNKSFTGYNGRIKSKSTGMGLYISKELCNKLGHNIDIKSEKDKYTIVCITFNNHEFYNVIS